jgi:hypothetical protein
MLAGDAKVTIVSKKTGDRFTYRVVAKKNPSQQLPLSGETPARTVHFVSVLNGPDNETDYRFIGTIFNGQVYAHGRKSNISAEAPSAKAFQWCWANLGSEAWELWHSGRCARCHRELTDPESIERGLGPVCAEAS